MAELWEEGEVTEEDLTVHPVPILRVRAVEGPRPPEIRVMMHRGYRIQWVEGGSWQVYAPDTGAVRQDNDLFMSAEVAKDWIDAQLGPELELEEKLRRRSIEFTRLMSRLFTRHHSVVLGEEQGQMIYDDMEPVARWFAGDIAYEITVRAFVPEEGG